VYIEGIGRVDFLVRGMATLRFDYREIVYGADEVVRTIKAVLALGPCTERTFLPWSGGPRIRPAPHFRRTPGTTAGIRPG
jgi:hypothetical protein